MDVSFLFFFYSIKFFTQRRSERIRRKGDKCRQGFCFLWLISTFAPSTSFCWALYILFKRDARLLCTNPRMRFTACKYTRTSHSLFNPCCRVKKIECEHLQTFNSTNTEMVLWSIWTGIEPQFAFFVMQCSRMLGRGYLLLVVVERRVAH